MQRPNLKFFFVILINCYFNIKCREDWRKIKVPLGSIEPDTAMVNEGNSITFHCGSRMAVTWTFSSDNIPMNQKKSTSLQDLTLFDLEEQNSGSYYCNGANFTAKSFLIVLPHASAHRVTPSWIETAEGSSVTLTCSGMKGVEWFGVHLHNQSKSLNDNTLTLHNLQRKHSGLYYCRNKMNYQGKVTHSNARLIVDGYVELISAELF